MKGTVVGVGPEGLGAEDEEHWNVVNGQQLDIVAVIPGDSLPWVVWVDEEGRINKIPAWTVRIDRSTL